jgi:DNA-binding CsgD family transcriptional regulator
MRGARVDRRRAIGRPYGLVVRIGLLTAAVILLFQMVNLLVMYRYLKLDLYLSLVAVFFLAIGLLINRQRGEVQEGEKGTGVRDEPAVPQVLKTLSAKEWQILKLVAEGRTNKEIAAAQFVELSTVKSHLNNIYGKLSVSNRKEARVKYAELAPQWPGLG